MLTHPQPPPGDGSHSRNGPRALGQGKAGRSVREGRTLCRIADATANALADANGVGDQNVVLKTTPAPPWLSGTIAASVVGGFWSCVNM